MNPVPVFEVEGLPEVVAIGFIHERRVSVDADDAQGHQRQVGGHGGLHVEPDVHAWEAIQ